MEDNTIEKIPEKLTEDINRIQVPIETNKIKMYDWVKDTPNRPISMLVDGIRNSGKSYLMEQIIPILINKNNVRKVILVSGTSKIQTNFDFIRKQDKYEPSQLNDVIENLISIQTKKSKSGIKPPRVMLILDDVVATTSGGSKIRYNKNLEFLYIGGRHYHIDIITIVQNLLAVPPSIRQNSDVLVIFKTPNLNKQKFIIDNFISGTVGNRKESRDLLMEQIFTEPYRALVVNLHNIQNAFSIYDYVYYYKA
jgi:hypothetical protein